MLREARAKKYKPSLEEELEKPKPLDDKCSNKDGHGYIKEDGGRDKYVIYCKYCGLVKNIIYVRSFGGISTTRGCQYKPSGSLLLVNFMKKEGKDIT